MSLRALLSALVACMVPIVLAGNALLVLAWGWLPRAIYALPGVPDDDGFTNAQRLALARNGVDSIQPWDAGGTAALRAARLPDGSAAFNARELSHMHDVRSVMTGLLIAWVLAVAVLALTMVLTRGRAGARAAVHRGLRWGAVAAIVLLGLAALFMLTDFDAFFTAFHGIFFEGDSWRFPSTDTLRRIYPDAFWVAAGGALAVLTISQALLLAVLARERRLSAWTSS